MEENIVEYIVKNMESFSKRRRILGAYIAENCEKAAYMTAAKLAAKTGVSESTVVRFAAELGFDGYQEFRKELLNVAKMKLTNIQRIELASDRIDPKNVFESVARADIQSIENAMAELDIKEFDAAVETLMDAQTIYVIGARSAASLANFTYIYLNMLFPDVRLVSSVIAGDMFSQMIHAKKGDAVIAISFPRYSKTTYNAVNFAYKHGADVIALTDSRNAPIVNTATHSLITGNGKIDSFADSLVAPMCVLNALVCALGIKRKHEAAETFEKQESVLGAYDLIRKE